MIPRRAATEVISDDILTYLYSGIPFLLRRADQRAVALFNEALGSGDVTLTQTHLLIAVDRVGPMSQAEVGRLIGVDSSTGSMVAKTLMGRGLLERRPSEHDKRCKILVATDAGSTLVSETLPVMIRAVGTLQAPLGGDVDRLLDLLGRVVASHENPGDVDEARMPQALRSIRRSLHFLLRRCIQLSEASAAARIDTDSLTLRQYAVLLIIALAPGIGETAIAQTLGYELSNTGFIARHLVSKQLVIPQMRGRRRMYLPSDKGLSQLLEAEPLLFRANETLLSALSEEERRETRRLLARIIVSDGNGGPPAFARVTGRTDWPTTTRPNFYAEAFGSPRIAAANSTPALEQMLIQAADRARRDHVATVLSQPDRIELERLLKLIVEP